MSEKHSRSSGESRSQETPPEQEGTHPLEQREERRENRTKNTLVWRELSIIAALGVVILAFNLNWGSPEGKQDMAAKKHDEIRLRDVRPTPPEPEPPEPDPPEPEPDPPEPKPKLPKNVERKEVPDEQVKEDPEPSDEPVTEPIKDLKTTPTEPTTSEPAPEPSPEPAPEPDPPPKNKVFSKGTADQNAQMKGSLQPEYPSKAKQAGIEGRVILQFVVDESGRPQGISVLRSPNDALSDAAVEALQSKSFTPARQNGKTVKMRMSQPVTFRLQ